MLFSILLLTVPLSHTTTIYQILNPKPYIILHHTVNYWRITWKLILCLGFRDIRELQNEIDNDHGKLNRNGVCFEA